MSLMCIKIVLPDDATLLSGRTRPCPQWWRANQAQCQPLIYTDYIQESIRYKFCSLRRAKPANNLFNQTSAPMSTLLLTFSSHAEFTEYAELPFFESLVHAGAGFHRMALVSLCLPGGMSTNVLCVHSFSPRQPSWRSLRQILRIQFLLFVGLLFSTY